MVRAEAAAAAAAVMVVVSVAVMVTATPVLGVITADSDAPCDGSVWLRSEGPGSRLLISDQDTRAHHPPVPALLSWPTLKEDAKNRGAELRDALPKDGAPLPVQTCQAPSIPCNNTIAANASCRRVVKQALCITVGGECQALMVTVKEPLGCCCGMKEQNETLAGRVTDMWLTKPCPPSFNNTRKGGKEKEGGRDTDEHFLSFKGSTSLPVVEEVTEVDNSTNDGNNEQVKEGEEIIEKHVKDMTVWEDVMAALVFLFVGAVLVIIKSRLFRFTKKKIQQEDKDTDSEVTLMEETMI